MVGAVVPVLAAGAASAPFAIGDDFPILGVALLVVGLAGRGVLDVCVRVCPLVVGVRSLVTVMSAALLVSTTLVIGGSVLIALEAVR